MAAMISAQTALPAIISGPRAAAAPWREGDGLAIPIAAVAPAGSPR